MSLWRHTDAALLFFSGDSSLEVYSLLSSLSDMTPPDPFIFVPLPVLALLYLPVSVQTLKPDRKSECVPPLPTAKYIPQTLLHPLVNSVVLVFHLCSVLPRQGLIFASNNHVFISLVEVFIYLFLITITKSLVGCRWKPIIYYKSIAYLFKELRCGKIWVLFITNIHTHFPCESIHTHISTELDKLYNYLWY